MQVCEIKKEKGRGTGLQHLITSEEQNPFLIFTSLNDTSMNLFRAKREMMVDSEKTGGVG